MNAKQKITLSILAVGISAWFALDLGRFLEVDILQQQLDGLSGFYAAEPVLAGLLYMLFYIAVTALSLPGAAVMTLAGGALFGFWYGLLLVSFASSIGATLACLVARILLRDWVQGRFQGQLRSVNAGFSREGALYLFGLRLVPLFPFFVINLVMGLLPISLRRFYWVSQLGMLPATAVYVNAGTQLGQLQGLEGILSPGLIGSFVLLGLFPLLAQRVLGWFRTRRIMGRFKRPAVFDDNVLVIGAGSAGLVAALIAATVKARVTLVERDKMGGDCLNTGCVPSKALIRSARIADYMRRAPEFGLAPVAVGVDFPEVMQRVKSIIARIEPHDSVERFTSLGVNCIAGEARLLSPWEVKIGDEVRSARNIIIASGARPLVPPIPGLAEQDYLTSDTIWELTELPQRLLVLGAGPIGCELAQSLASLGSAVTLVDMAPQVLPREDSEVSALVHESLQASGIRVLVNHRAMQFAEDESGCVAEFDYAGELVSVSYDRVLVALGRRANVEGMGLEELGVAVSDTGTLAVDEFLCTTVPGIYAAGDVAGPYQFTHMASHQAWYATVNALFGGYKRFKVDYSVVPWATFTSPEVARVGLNEADANAQGISYEVARYDIDDLDRAIADGEGHGFIKVLTPPGKDKILGVTIVGYHAAELLAEYVLAMKHGIGLNKILGTVHVYPTLAEANKFVASEWRKAHKPERLLRWVEHFHSWRRG